MNRELSFMFAETKLLHHERVEIFGKRPFFHVSGYALSADDH